jgi:error-prone DNA polymerase
LKVDALEGLAAAGALESLGLTRREGLWAAGALAEISPDRLPLSPGADPPQLPGMSEEKEAQADLWATGISMRHPVEFVRDRLDALGCLTVARALAAERNGVRASIGGIVTHRQRPSTAKGVIFFNLEDETGLLNVIVLPDIWQANREVARRNPGLVIGGVLEYRDGVTNFVARSFMPWPAKGVTSRNFR